MSIEACSSTFHVEIPSLDAMEWPHLKDELALRAKTVGGKRACLTLTPGLLSFDDARHQSQAVLEIISLQREEKLVLPLLEVPDVSETLKRIRRLSSIGVEDFANLVRFMRAVQGLSHFLHRYGANRKALLDRLKGFDLLEDWSREHFALLTPLGDIADHASGDLKALRKFSADLHEKIKHRLEDYLQNPKMAELMQDFYVTLRDGRYVLPIKNNFKGRVPGIIHDVSKTEQTFFVEPQEIVDWNNQLKVCEKEIEREIEKILAEVVRKSQPYVGAFEKNRELLNLADLMSAAGELSIALNTNFCSFQESTSLEFTELVHPLLGLKQKVVPNSFGFEGGLILTGPNTGGKTVLLKSVGLGLCMARSGLPVPAKNMNLPRDLHSVHVDIGDDQNLDKNLSTFSGHLQVMRQMLENSQPGDLLLIDEICTGTSPEEGQPLAQALIEEFLTKNLRVFVTTHYGALKTFAMTEARLRIAAMSFDAKTKRPTFEILMDIPGNSSAFETAEALGFSPGILNRARKLQGEVSEDFSRAVQRLDQARENFLNREKQLEEREEKSQRLHALSQEKIVEFEAKQRQGLAEEARKVLKELTGLREELSQKIKEATLTELSTGATTLFTKVSELGDRVRGVMGEARRAEASTTPMDDSELCLEAVVEVEGLGIGTVLDLPKGFDARSLITVQVGDLKARVPRSRLLKPARDRVQSFAASQKASLAAKERKLTLTAVGSGKSSGSVICDVRGRNFDEAMRRVESSLNELARDEDAVITIIHGHGSDRLKEGIRDYLQAKRDDLAFRPGTWPGEGGDGVTLVERSRLQ